MMDDDDKVPTATTQGAPPPRFSHVVPLVVPSEPRPSRMNTTKSQPLTVGTDTSLKFHDTHLSSSSLGARSSNVFKGLTLLSSWSSLSSLFDSVATRIVTMAMPTGPNIVDKNNNRTMYQQPSSFFLPSAPIPVDIIELYQSHHPYSSCNSILSRLLTTRTIGTTRMEGGTPVVLAEERLHQQPQQQPPLLPPPLHHSNVHTESRSTEAMKQLLCGGIAGSIAKTVTAPLSRLTILYQVHPLVTTHENRPKFAMTMSNGIMKIIERGGVVSLWKGNLTSVLHRFPYSAINFYVYENTLDLLAVQQQQQQQQPTNLPQDQHPLDAIAIPNRLPEQNETKAQLVRRVSRIIVTTGSSSANVQDDHAMGGHGHVSIVPRSSTPHHQVVRRSSISTAADTTLTITTSSSSINRKRSDSDSHNNNNNNGMMHHAATTPASHKFIAGAMAGTVACLMCYPLDLVRTRLTTELEGQEHYRGIIDAFRKIYRTEGMNGFYSGIIPTLLVAVPNFAISYTVYGTLKEHALDDDLFYNLRKIDDDSHEPKLGFLLTLMCGATSGIIATMVTFPMDTIRRRMQIQALHVPNVSLRQNTSQLMHQLIRKEGFQSLYWGLTPELIKVIPMVGTMFTVYEWTKDMLHISHDRR